MMPKLINMEVDSCASCPFGQDIKQRCIYNPSIDISDMENDPSKGIHPDCTLPDKENK